MIEPKENPAFTNDLFLAQFTKDLFLAPSEICKKYNIQNCHFCDDIDCGDNTSKAKKMIASFEAVIKGIS